MESFCKDVSRGQGKRCDFSTTRTQNEGHTEGFLPGDMEEQIR